MGKFNNFLLLIFVPVIFSLLLVGREVFATVGGPTYISSVAFQAQDNSVYYLVHDNSGRGCPPIIHRVNLAILEDREVKSCEQVEQEFPQTEEGRQKYNEFIADTYQNPPYLGSVSLKKNNIDVAVEFLSEHIEDGYPLWSEFRAAFFQDKKEVGRIDFRGCAKNQPHVFEGYYIPDSDALAVLISNKGDCFEGGYVKEVLRVVKGVKYYDTNIVRSFKGELATKPNLGNLVVYGVLEEAGKDEKAPVLLKTFALNFIFLAVTFVAGIVLGYILGKRHLKSN